MALVLDATAGGTAANTYCTRTEADTYHESHLYASVWTAATVGLKDKALVMATRILDEQIIWSGWKATKEQALAWPRLGMVDREGYAIMSTIIPAFLKNATAEFARHLLVLDRTAESDTKGFKSIGVGDIQLQPDKYDRPAVIPPSVMAMIRFCGIRQSQGRILVRV